MKEIEISKELKEKIANKIKEFYLVQSTFKTIKQVKSFFAQCGVSCGTHSFNVIVIFKKDNLYFVEW